MWYVQMIIISLLAPSASTSQSLLDVCYEYGIELVMTYCLTLLNQCALFSN